MPSQNFFLFAEMCRADKLTPICKLYNVGMHYKTNVIYIITPQKWDCIIEWFKASAIRGGLYHTDRRPDPGCWLRSEFDSPWGRLIVSLFQGSYQVWTLLCSDNTCALLGLRANKPRLYPFIFFNFLYIFSNT